MVAGAAFAFVVAVFVFGAGDALVLAAAGLLAPQAGAAGLLAPAVAVAGLPEAVGGRGLDAARC